MPASMLVSTAATATGSACNTPSAVEAGDAAGVETAAESQDGVFVDGGFGEVAARGWTAGEMGVC